MFCRFCELHPYVTAPGPSCCPHCWSTRWMSPSCGWNSLEGWRKWDAQWKSRNQHTIHARTNNFLNLPTMTFVSHFSTAVHFQFTSSSCEESYTSNPAKNIYYCGLSRQTQFTVCPHPSTTSATFTSAVFLSSITRVFRFCAAVVLSPFCQPHPLSTCCSVVFLKCFTS